VARVVLAFVFVPLFASFFFGPLFVVVAPIAWAACLILAVPLFIVFLGRGWLQCWQVVMAGLICGLLSVALLTLGDGLYSTIQGPANLAMGPALGGAIAYGFWWFGLYRNPRFGTPGGTSLITALYPLLVLTVLGSLSALYAASLADAVALEARPTTDSRGTVRIQLTDGTITDAVLADGGRLPLPGEKLTVESRRAVTMVGRRYWIIARASAAVTN
jgi:hypothetical protein